MNEQTRALVDTATQELTASAFIAASRGEPPMWPGIAARTVARVLDRLADEHVQFTPAALRSLAAQTRAEEMSASEPAASQHRTVKRLLGKAEYVLVEHTPGDDHTGRAARKVTSVLLREIADELLEALLSHVEPGMMVRPNVIPGLLREWAEDIETGS